LGHVGQDFQQWEDICLPFISWRRPRTPSREAQSYTSPLCSPIRKSIESTSHKPHSPIYATNGDVLLNIFYLCRFHIGYDEDARDVFLKRKCDRQRLWYKLAQVSRRWRYPMVASRSLLALHLLCTYGVPVADMLAHSPPFPLTIFYYDGDRRMTAEDEEGALAYMWLGRITRSAYFPPGQILTRLAFMPQLEKLGIGFHSSCPNRDVVGQLLDTLITTYSKSIFSIRSLTVPRLLQFMQTSENVSFNALELAFDRGFVHLMADPHQTRRKQPLYMRITCRDLDW
jgi:hypothetical protein